MRRNIIRICVVAVLAAAVWYYHGGSAYPTGDVPEDWSASENFYRVSPELYRSAQPSAEMMRKYEEYGIKTVINLRSFNSDRQEVQGTGLTLIEIPVLTWDLDTDEVIAVLRAIRKAEKPVLIHCQHGSDRTGLMVAMYRIVEQGWTKDKAINEMKNGPYGFHSIWVHIDDFIMEADIDAIKRAL